MVVRAAGAGKRSGGKPPPPLHVTPRGDDWVVKRAGGQRASSTHDTQKGALDVARQQAKKEGGQVKVHGEDGRIREERTYRTDPNPPKG